LLQSFEHMTTKVKLIEKINSIQNESYLEAILNYLEESEKAAIQLTETDIREIKESESQLRNGMFISQDKLRIKVNEWLEK